MGVKISKNKPILFTLALLVFSLVTSLIPTTTFASTYSDTTDLNKKTAMYDYAQMIYGCYLGDDGVETNGAKVANNQLFYFGPGVKDVGAVSYTPQIVGAVPDLGDDFYTYCGSNDGALSKAALSALGVKGLDLVCAMGYKREGQGADCKQSTDKNFQAWGGINGASARANAFKSTIKSLSGVDIDNPGKDVEYTYWKNYVIKGCTTGTGVAAGETSVSGDMRYELREVKNSAEVKMVYSGGKKTSEYPRANSRNVPNNVTCGTALSRANAAFDGYFQASKESAARKACQALGYTNVPGGSFPGKNDLTACIQGTLNKSSDRFCNSAYPDYTYQGVSISRASEQAACEAGRGQTVDLTDDIGVVDPTVTESTATNCVIEGIGWIVCPVISVVANITDSLYGWIQSFLVVQPLNLDTAKSDNTSYIAWAGMRNIANVAFVIVFLIIIFSQLTSTGVSNYGIKKMLPRLVVAAILVNISFWVCAIAVDISNVVGNNIYNILRNINLNNITITDNLWESLFGWLLAGGVVAGGVAAAPLIAGGLGAFSTALLWAAVVFVLSAVLALIVAFIILAARQALIIMMIVLSPLAFVALLLPNTEKYFTLWRKTLTTLLIFYPLFSVLFGGSFLAGVIIIGSAGQANAEAPSGILVLLGMTVMIIPLFITPLILKFSSGVLGTVAGMVTNKNRGLIDRAKNVRNRKAGLALGEAMNNPNRSKNPFARVYRKMQTSSRGDADRKSTIENTNQAKYLESQVGQNFTDKTATSGQRVDAAKAEDKARMDTRKNTNAENRGYNQRIENAGVTSTTQAGITAAAKEKRILETPGLMNQIQQQDASKREEARHVALQGQQVAQNTSAGTLGMDRQKADAELKTTNIKDTNALGIKRAQQFDPSMRSSVLEQAAIKKEADSVEKQLQQTVAEAGTTAGAAKLAGQGYSQSVIDRVQAAEEATADTELRIKHASEEGELETITRQNSDLELSNVKLSTEAAKQALNSEGKRFEQVVAEAASTVGGDQLKQAGYSPEAINSIQASQVETAVTGAAINAAGRVQQEELTTMIRNEDALPSGQKITEAMAGIDTTNGEALVTAQAIETQRKAREGNVSAFTIQHRDAGINTEALSTMAQTQNVSAAEREAAGRAVVESGNIDVIKPYLQYLSTALENAPTEQEKDVIRDLQKATGERIANSPGKPIGIGAGEIAALRDGTYSTPSITSDLVRPVTASQHAIFTDPNTGTDAIQTFNTIMVKGVSAEGWSSMDKNDIGTITAIAADPGLIPPERASTLKASIQAALTDPRIKNRIKERETKLLHDLYVNQFGGSEADIQPRANRP